MSEIKEPVDRSLTDAGKSFITHEIRSLIGGVHFRVLLFFAIAFPFVGFLAKDLALGIPPQRLYWDGGMGLLRMYPLIAAFLLGWAYPSPRNPLIGSSRVVAGFGMDVRWLAAHMGLLGFLMLVLMAMVIVVSLATSYHAMLPWSYWAAFLAQGWVWFWVGSLWLLTAKMLGELFRSFAVGQTLTFILLALGILKPWWIEVLATESRILQIVVAFARRVVPDVHGWDLWLPGADTHAKLLQVVMDATVAIFLLMVAAWSVLWLVWKLRIPNSSRSQD